MTWQQARQHLSSTPYDLRATAKLIYCHQDIDSCFALGMIARFGIALKQPWPRRHLFWECSILNR